MTDVLVKVEIRLGLDAHPNSLYALGNIAGDDRDPIYVASERITAIVIRKPNQAPPEYEVAIEQPLMGVRSDEREIFDSEACIYTLGPIPQAHLDALLQPELTLEVQLTWTYFEIFDAILQDWLSSDVNKTLANRRDDDPILATILAAKNLGSNKAQVPFELREKRARISVAAHIVQQDPESSRLLLALDPASSDERVLLARMLVAADWSVLSERALTPPVDSLTLSPELRVAVLNVQCLLAWRLDIERGRAIHQSIVFRNLGHLDARQLVIATRRDIDQFLIAANHWGEAREASDSADPIERYQSRMSDFFGMLYEKYTLASPVNLVRGLFGGSGAFGPGLPLADAYHGTIWLQLGVGHCGEHAVTAYAILARMRDHGADQVIRHVIRSGNVNIDHAFVLVNVAVNEYFVTRVLNSASFRALRSEVSVIDLGDTLSAAVNAEGLVLDAYLQLERFDASAGELLDSLAKKRNKTLLTSFVMHYESTPKSPGFTKVDRLDQDDATLRKQFENV